MTSPVARLLLEASVAAANQNSAAHRSAAAREVFNLGADELVGDDVAASHLRMAIREAVITMALSRDPAVIAEVAAATQSMVRAARRRAQPTATGAAATQRPWWVDGGGAA